MARGELPVHEKASHKEVDYTRPSEHVGQSCGDCKSVIEEIGADVRCKTVASPIYLNGWCTRWPGKGKPVVEKTEKEKY